MDSTSETLEKETKKWLARLQEKNPPADHQDSLVKEQLTNVHAYIQDCQHFLKNGDLIRAFEAIIYAWGIYETLSRMHLLKEDDSKS